MLYCSGANDSDDLLPVAGSACPVIALEDGQVFAITGGSLRSRTSLHVGREDPRSRQDLPAMKNPFQDSDENPKKTENSLWVSLPQGKTIKEMGFVSNRSPDIIFAPSSSGNQGSLSSKPLPGSLTELLPSADQDTAPSHRLLGAHRRSAGDEHTVAKWQHPSGPRIRAVLQQFFPQMMGLKGVFAIQNPVTAVQLPLSSWDLQQARYQQGREGDGHLFSVR